MKILFTAPRFHTNQSAIVKGLKEKGHDVRYFVVFVGATEDHSVVEPLVLKPSRTTVKEKKALLKTSDESSVESIIGGHFIPDFKFFLRAFEDFMPDVVICREKTNLTLYAKYMCDLHGIPCVLYDQEPIYPSAKKEKTRPAQTKNNSILKRISAKADKLFNGDRRLISKMRAASGFPTVHMTPVMFDRLPKETPEGGKKDKTFFIPFIGEYHAEASARVYREKGVLRILSVGKFRDYKNLKILPDAMEEMIKCGFDGWFLTIVGQAASPDEKEYYNDVSLAFADKGLGDKVKILLNVPFSGMGQIYSDNDLFVLTSKREVASVAIIEAMSYGLAVVSTNYNGTASYAVDAGAGCVFETENAKDLADKIALISADVEKLGKNAADFVEKNLQFGNYYGVLSDMLKKEFDLQTDGDSL